jgi:antitoxin component YwqK of YwqJK toxin-antitoxin module
MERFFLGTDPYKEKENTVYSYWSNGALHFMSTYNENSELVGAQKVYNPKGLLKSCSFYQKNLREGEFLHFLYE